MPDVDLPDASFDAITASSVLEHVADPSGFLRKAHALLRPGGVIFVRVPNLGLLRAFFVARRLERLPGTRACLRILRREIMDEESLFHVIDPPAHLYGLDARTLSAALARAGFSRIRLEADPMQVRGSWVNRVVDGGVYAAACALRVASRGTVILSPNVSAWAWK